MKVLITGASSGAAQGGIIQTLEKEVDLRLTDRRPVDKRFKHEFVKAEIRDIKDVRKAVKGMDAVIHLGAVLCDSLLTYSTNVMGTANLLEASRENNIKKFIYAGSVHVYGMPINPDYLPIDEEHPLRPFAPYGLSKLMAEELGRGYVRGNSNFTFISLRLGRICCGKYPYSNFKADNIGDHKKSLWGHIHAKDLGRLIRGCLLKDIKGFEVFNALGQDHAFSEISSLDLIKRFFPGIKKVYNNDEFITKPDRTFISIKKAKEMLGYKPKYNFTDYQKWLKRGRKEEDYYF